MGEMVGDAVQGAKMHHFRLADDTLGTPKSTKSLHPVYGR
jgi:hypothetical protein